MTRVLRLSYVTSRRLPAFCAAVLVAGLLAAACDGSSNGTSETAATTSAQDVGSTYFVAPGGDDAGPGSMARPWRTIRRALDRLEPGDVVRVRAGTYREDIDIARSGSDEEPVSVEAFPGERPRLTGRLKVAGDHVRISGFVIEGRTPANPTDVAVYVSGADDVRILRNEITRAGQSGVFVGDGSTRTRIDSNWIHENGRNDLLDHGIYVERAEGTLIANNVIEANVGYGVQLYPDADDSVVTQNTIVRNGRSGVIVGGEDTTSDGNTVVNNIVAFNGEQGIRTFWDGPVGRRNVAATNLVYENPEGAVVGAGLRASGTLAEHPRFVDAPGGDYRLAPDSAAIDAASATNTMPYDVEGRRRPRGERPDLGAFER